MRFLGGDYIESIRGLILPERELEFAVQGGPVDCTSGVTFSVLVDGKSTKMQLLGLSEEEDSLKRTQARLFAQKWFRSQSNYFDVTGWNRDGVLTVWLQGHNAFVSSLNLELARAGLVRVDTKTNEDMVIHVWRMEEGHVVFDWKKAINKAQESGRRGEKPEVLFPWPDDQGRRKDSHVGEDKLSGKKRCQERMPLS
jgi:hypothetical protein